MKRIESFLLIFMVLISCLMGSSGFATGSSENSEVIQNNTSSAEPVIRNACINPNFLDSGRSDSIEPVITDDHGRALGSGYKPSPVDMSGLSRSEKKLLVRAPQAPTFRLFMICARKGKQQLQGTRDRVDAVGPFQVWLLLNHIFWEQKE